MKRVYAKKISILFLILSFSLALFAGPVAAAPAPLSAGEPRPIVVQGAMTIESMKLAGLLENAVQKTLGPFTFWVGTIDGYPVVVSKTRIGVANSAAATALAIENFNPIAVINQGTAGGHDPALKVYDIVLGVKILNAGAIKSNPKALGQGSSPLEWRLVDWRQFDEGGDGRSALGPAIFASDPALVKIAHSIKNKYTKGKIVEGVIVSADVWNQELDRIKWFHDKFASAAEEMETAAAAQICSLYKVPFLSIRILSNNATTGQGFIPATGEAVQEFTYEVLKAYIETL